MQSCTRCTKPSCRKSTNESSLQCLRIIINGPWVQLALDASIMWHRLLHGIRVVVVTLRWWTDCDERRVPSQTLSTIVKSRTSSFQPTDSLDSSSSGWFPVTHVYRRACWARQRTSFIRGTRNDRRLIRLRGIIYARSSYNAWKDWTQSATYCRYRSQSHLMKRCGTRSWYATYWPVIVVWVGSLSPCTKWLNQSSNDKNVFMPARGMNLFVSYFHVWSFCFFSLMAIDATTLIYFFTYTFVDLLLS